MHGLRMNEKSLQPMQAPSYSSSVKEDNFTRKLVPGILGTAPDGNGGAVTYHGRIDGPPGRFRKGRFVWNTSAPPRSIALVQQVVEILRHVIATDLPIVDPGSDPKTKQ